MVAGAPRMAPRAADVDEYRTAGTNAQLEIGAYVGIPLLGRDGELFGTLCAIDSAPQSDGVRDDEALAAMFARLLGTVLQQELRAIEDAQRLELSARPH